MQVRAGDDPDVDLSKLVADTADEERGLCTFNAAHIAANDPASVLRLCDGLESLLDVHAGYSAAEFCTTCREMRCPTLQALASMLGVGETE